MPLFCIFYLGIEPKNNYIRNDENRHTKSKTHIKSSLKISQKNKKESIHTLVIHQRIYHICGEI